jgi:hydrogenase maturation protein HypF
MLIGELIRTLRLARDPSRLRLVVRGRVQGVGFRPGVFRIARRAGIGGSVRNTRRGVVIEAEGPAEAIRAFVAGLDGDLPPLARIDDVSVEEIEPRGETDFAIARSEDPGAAEALFPVDAATCADCLREMRDPADRRYRYPFINCTNCGPRFTIIEGLPYDRPLTTMRVFAMDDPCRAQYADPADRRFHAEPISCPGCGPVLRLVDGVGHEIPGDPVGEACALLAAGRILAVKGLGGYHFAVSATDEEAVRRLRERKRRPAKPFACMFRDLAAVRRYCVLNDVERRLLESVEAPIVLLRRGARRLPDAVAPRNAYLGAFLPYTPLHHLLMERFEILVMTSGNFTDEPLISNEGELETVLGPIADAALVHDRRIAHKCDDSIFFVPGGVPVPVRRARGFVPEPIMLPFAAETPIVALGAQEKSTFALARDDRAFVSPHLGDLGDIRSDDNFRRELASFERMLAVEPRICAHDLHYDYYTTRLAAVLPVDARIAVQHHHAHAASVMVEHGLAGPVIAAAFDGTGYGTDGKLWGGEFLLARYDSFERLAALAYVPLPGGEAAIHEPWRMALMYLHRLHGDGVLSRLPRGVAFEGFPAADVLSIARRGINAPHTSSMGRLFDAAAYLLGCGARASYEAEAAVALESLALEARDTAKSYAFGTEEKGFVEIDPSPVVAGMLADIASGVPPPEIAAAFHRAVAGLVLTAGAGFARSRGCSDVVLSGGCFQNRLLCEYVMEGARALPERFYLHALVPPNDGGVSLGQLAVGIARLRSEGRM